jgi:hypothetical protein
MTVRAPVADRSIPLEEGNRAQAFELLDRLAARGALCFSVAIPLVVMLGYATIAGFYGSPVRLGVR